MQKKYKALWLNKDGNLEVIDQRYLPFAKKICVLRTAHDTCEAIKDMTVLGQPFCLRMQQ